MRADATEISAKKITAEVRKNNMRMSEMRTADPTRMPVVTQPIVGRGGGARAPQLVGGDPPPHFVGCGEVFGVLAVLEPARVRAKRVWLGRPGLGGAGFGWSGCLRCLRVWLGRPGWRSGSAERGWSLIGLEQSECAERVKLVALHKIKEQGVVLIDVLRNLSL